MRACGLYRVCCVQVIQELQDLVQQKERFLNGMSHELRTPLNGIIGLSDAALVGSCGEVRAPPAAAGRARSPWRWHAGRPRPHHRLLPLSTTLAARVAWGAAAGILAQVSEPMHKTLSTIKLSGSRLLSLINDVLDAATARQVRAPPTGLPRRSPFLCVCVRRERFKHSVLGRLPRSVRGRSTRAS